MKSFFETSFGAMASNYLKIAWRNLLKNKVFGFINIFAWLVLFDAFYGCIKNQGNRHSKSIG